MKTHVAFIMQTTVGANASGKNQVSCRAYLVDEIELEMMQKGEWDKNLPFVRGELAGAIGLQNPEYWAALRVISGDSPLRLLELLEKAFESGFVVKSAPSSVKA
ncbi:MAG: hypothetical protein RIT04_626 [Candidatus Parcubacteria bacterium]|jgi:hypothetical protein